MALFNKLFTFKKFNENKSESSSEKIFAFNKEKVRVVLFRECDFRGRKLLFDSTAIEVVQIDKTRSNSLSANNKPNRSFVEVHTGYGYKYTKPQNDSSQLADMIFGLVAMSYRGSYFKIHNLDSPHRLMLTQVFPSPTKTTTSKSNGSSQSCMSSQSLEHSMKFDDSGRSSINSISDHLSVHSTASDTVLVCRRKQSLPYSAKYANSNKSDSNFVFNPLFGSSKNFMSDFITDQISFSNSTIYKRSLRSSSTSLEQSMSSMGSIDDCFGRPQLRSGKLGLAFIIEFTKNQEEIQFQFFMEHIALIESMLYRARQAIQYAYMRPNSFLSLLTKMVDISTNWLIKLLSGPTLTSNLWLSISNSSYSCDNSSICAFNNNKTEEQMIRSMNYDLSENVNDFTRSFNLLSNNDYCDNEFSFLNITKFFKGEWDSILYIRKFPKQTASEKFISEFCELLETVDVKDTNFFISTLLTAILTHHLGWVSTCLPAENSCCVPPTTPYNPLWGQLSDLYGSVGYPVKMAQTILTGVKQKDLIPKIINSLTYFIRCSNIERQFFMRVNVEEDNKIADGICQKQSCIPKANFKKYKDHLREMIEEKHNQDIAKLKEQDINENIIQLKRINTPISFNEQKTILEPKSRLDLPIKKINKTKNNLIENNSLKCSKKLIKISNCNNLCKLEKSYDTENSPEVKNKEENLNKNVVFLLGDGDELVDLKKDTHDNKSLNKIDPTVNLLETIFKKYEKFEQEFIKSQFKDEDFVKNEAETSLKPSPSWANLPQDINRLDNENIVTKSESNKNFNRARSMPPEECEKEVKIEVKAKYKYNGMKFNLHQYPQVVTNYMRSKNLEMANLPLIGLTKKFDQISFESGETNVDLSGFEQNYDEMEAFQTPSNASDLEFTSDLVMDYPGSCKAKEVVVKESNLKFNRTSMPNTSVRTHENEKKDKLTENTYMKTFEFPMPQSTAPTKVEQFSFSKSLIKSIDECYIPDLVLQGTKVPKCEWESKLKNNLALLSQHPLLDVEVDEAVAIIADTDAWEVQLVSSHTYVIDKSSSGIKVGMSQLVSDMLDSLLKMWKLQVPPHFCILHIEQRLQELCVRSKALAQLLLTTEFCSMELLTSTLQLEINDVPLLLAVASTYSPQVTQKYGISFH